MRPWTVLLTCTSLLRAPYNKVRVCPKKIKMTDDGGGVCVVNASIEGAARFVVVTVIT